MLHFHEILKRVVVPTYDLKMIMLAVSLLGISTILVNESKDLGTSTFLEAVWLQKTRNNSIIHQWRAG